MDVCYELVCQTQLRTFEKRQFASLQLKVGVCSHILPSSNETQFHTQLECLKAKTVTPVFLLGCLLTNGCNYEELQSIRV